MGLEHFFPGSSLTWHVEFSLQISGIEIPHSRPIILSFIQPAATWEAQSLTLWGGVDLDPVQEPTRWTPWWWRRIAGYSVCCLYQLNFSLQSLSFPHLSCRAQFESFPGRPSPPPPQWTHWSSPVRTYSYSSCKPSGWRSLREIYFNSNSVLFTHQHAAQGFLRVIIPVSSFSPNRMAMTLASVPAYFFSPVFIFRVYVVDMAVR